MYKNKIITLFFYILIFLVSCQKQQPRKPISRITKSFIDESIQRNKLIVSKQETLIDSFIKKDTINNYIPSNKGYWYCYKNKIETDLQLPQKGDVVIYEYDIKNLDGTTIYSKEELQPQTYHIDKEQEIINGLRHGIKLMKEGEIVTFIFPSHLAYGYRGDKNKIEINKPIVCTVTLKNVKFGASLNKND